ncbi:MAG: hypothetical protein AABY53_03540 [Bdellovibrionota bacterium]
MESSLIIKQKYFELVTKLNQSNKFKNQETDLYFFIDSTRPNYLKLYAAISDNQKIVLCYKYKQSQWLASQYSQFPSLEIFIARLLLFKEAQPDLTNHIKSHVFKLTN